jgi:hypothetical protein
LVEESNKNIWLSNASTEFVDWSWAIAARISTQVESVKYQEKYQNFQNSSSLRNVICGTAVNVVNAGEKKLRRDPL